MIFAPSHPDQEDGYLSADFGQFRVIGKSLAGIETVFTIPQLNITFDTGRAPPFSYHTDFLALTHWHLDHAGGLPNFLGLRCLNDLKPLTIVVPKAKLEESKIFLDTLKKITESRISYTVTEATDPIALRRNIDLHAITNFHCTPSTGYLIKETRHKLAQNLKSASPDEIIQAKKQGVNVQESFTESILAFSGDSTGEFLKTEARKARVLLMECSFFGDDSEYDKVIKYGHTHILDWAKHADQIESPHVVMTHTSVRYSRKEIEQACQKNLPKSLTDRLIIFR